jgi:hypothetical protein
MRRVYGMLGAAAVLAACLAAIPALPAAGAPTGQMTWVEEPALSLIPSFPYSAPNEDVRLKHIARRR